APLAALADGCCEITSWAAGPAVAVAVNGTGDPVSPALVALSVFAPAVVPSVHAGAVAMPAASVTTVPLSPSEPPPDATAKVTLTPATGLPLMSLTNTDGAVDTAVFTTAD